jgi:hypothetical protein
MFQFKKQTDIILVANEIFCYFVSGQYLASSSEILTQNKNISESSFGTLKKIMRFAI